MPQVLGESGRNERGFQLRCPPWVRSIAAQWCVRGKDEILRLWAQNDTPAGCYEKLAENPERTRNGFSCRGGAPPGHDYSE